MSGIVALRLVFVGGRTRSYVAGGPDWVFAQSCISPPSHPHSSRLVHPPPSACTIMERGGKQAPPAICSAPVARGAVVLPSASHE